MSKNSKNNRKIVNINTPSANDTNVEASIVETTATETVEVQNEIIAEVTKAVAPSMRDCNLRIAIEDVHIDNEAQVITFKEFNQYAKEPVIVSLPFASLYLYQFWLDCEGYSANIFQYLLEQKFAELPRTFFSKVKHVMAETKSTAKNYVEATAQMTPEQLQYISELVEQFYTNWYPQDTLLNFKLNDGSYNTGDLIYIQDHQYGEIAAKILWTAENSPITFVNMNSFGTVSKNVFCRSISAEELEPEYVQMLEESYAHFVELTTNDRAKIAKKYESQMKKQAEAEYANGQMKIEYDKLLADMSTLTTLEAIKEFRAVANKVKLSKELRHELNTLLGSIQADLQSVVQLANFNSMIAKLDKVVKAEQMDKIKEKMKGLNVSKEQRTTLNELIKSKFAPVKKEKTTEAIATEVGGNVMEQPIVAETHQEETEVVEEPKAETVTPKVTSTKRR